jgi:hypothetical protein
LLFLIQLAWFAEARSGAFRQGVAQIGAGFFRLGFVK